MSELLDAMTLRAIAERSCDPEAYERAAEAFTELDMPAAAEACERRAEHYLAEQREAARIQEQEQE
jgi:hypothetical protein